MRPDGTRVLLTGATGGIGHAIARTLASRGAELVLTGRRAEVLEPLAGELQGRALSCDLADPGEVQRLASEAGPIDIFVANAALPASGDLLELSQEAIDRSLDVNLRAPIALARALVPGMVQRSRGHLVFISSLSGKAASPASSIYSASKFGLRGFALGLREDLHQHGVGVSVVFPGFIRDAGMFADSGVVLPRGVGTRSPQDVADGVVKVIERNRAELDVAPLGLRLGTALALVLPGPAAAVSRRLGSGRISAAIAAGQSDKH